MKYNSLACLIAGAFFAQVAVATEVYDINLAYKGGSQVNFNGQVYEAKWYVNPGQTPTLSVGNEWDSPWQLVAGEIAVTPPDDTVTDAGTPAGNTGNNDTSAENANSSANPHAGTASAPQVNADGSVYFTQAQIAQKEAQMTDFPLMRAVKSSIATRDNITVEAVLPGRVDNPDNVKRVEGILPESGFNYLFPLRAPEYSYRGLLQAIAKFPALCGDYTDGRDSDAICRKSLATMFAHFAQETGAHDVWRPEGQWRQGLYWVREVGWDETKRGGYNMECNPAGWQGQEWPCGTFANGEFKSYFGRGAKQLSYNYNYGPFSDAMFGTVRTLLDNPEKVADTWLNLASAVFFFTYPQPPKPSMLHVIDGTWQPNAQDTQAKLVAGFGATTHIINGGIECGSGTEKPQSVNRIEYYRQHANYLNVPIAADEVLGCKDMKPFATGGAGALNIYWEQDWSYVAGNPNGGKSYACKLVGYQTRYSAFKAGDYGRCLQHFFPEVVIEAGGDTGEPTNQAPTAKIQGPTIAEANTAMVLSGQGSSDPESQMLTYLWQLPQGISSGDLTANTLSVTTPNVTQDSPYRFTLTVTDAAGLSHSATHDVVVKAPATEPPVEPPIVTPPVGSYPVYQAGSQYAAGDKVMNNNKLYQCKPYPYTAWCSGAAWAYEPGKGTAWADAWLSL